MPEDAISRRAMMSVVGGAAVALAGCSTTSDAPATETTTDPDSSATDPGTDAGATSTATETQAEEAGETDDESLPSPPGVTADGIEEPTKLIEATKTALKDNGYDITTTLVSGSADNEITQRYRSSPDQQRHYLTFDAPDETNEIYVADGTTYIKSTQDGETSYSQQATEQSVAELHTSADIVQMLGSGEGLGGILRVGRYTPGSMVAYNDRDVVSFDFDGVNASEITGTVSESSGNLLVAPEGVVFDAALVLSATTDGNTQVYENAFTITNLGSVEVPQPGWVADQF